MGSKNIFYYHRVAFYQNSPYYRKAARKYAEGLDHFMHLEDAYPEYDQKRDLKLIMTNYFNPYLRPLRIPRNFSLPEELARGHGINEHGVSACADMVYAETYGMIPHRDPYPPPAETPEIRIYLYVEHVMRRLDRGTMQLPPVEMTTTLIRKRRGAEYWMNRQTGRLESEPQTSVMVYTSPSKDPKVELQLGERCPRHTKILVH
ncbi:MAG: hypothetical protein Q9160_003149 [Pyrenula sp. 1 TL-2023]